MMDPYEVGWVRCTDQDHRLSGMQRVRCNGHSVSGYLSPPIVWSNSVTSDQEVCSSHSTLFESVLNAQREIEKINREDEKENENK